VVGVVDLSAFRPLQHLTDNLPKFSPDKQVNLRELNLRHILGQVVNAGAVSSQGDCRLLVAHHLVDNILSEPGILCRCNKAITQRMEDNSGTAIPGLTWVPDRIT